MRPIPLLAESGSLRRRVRRSKKVTVSRRALVAAGAVAGLLLAWSGASLWYMVSRDEVTFKLLERQATIKRGYEDKLVALRSRLDQVTTQRLVEHETLRGRIETLLARQAAFEARQSNAQALVERTGAVPEPPRDLKRDLGAGVSAYAPTARPALPDPFELRLSPPPEPVPERRSSLDDTIRSLDLAAARLDALAAAQDETLATLVARATGLGRRLEAALRRAGLEPRIAPASGTGGPFVPAGDANDPLVERAAQSVVRLIELRRSVAALPFGDPVAGEIDLSSGFGHRLDPFTRAPAMHTGLDFRAEPGAPVRATGRGRVAVAEWTGAYGNMVEVEHAQGVTSRYAHLSSIAVAVGQEVKPGALLGRVGSTGRSTGAHLHYETRINGDAVDPQRFLRAGAGLAAVITASR